MFHSPTSASASWHQWWQAQGSVFFLYARQQTRSEADAKDVLQESLIEAWRKSGDCIPDKAIVFATIRRRAIDLGRSTDRRSRRENAVAADRAEWFIPDFADFDTHHCISQAIAGLSHDLREVLVLRIWGDLSFPAIAQLMDSPVATAKSRYRYALEQLRETLTELKI
jgi:RNA polymerase sigma-70 factor (ECF subfamily)